MDISKETNINKLKALAYDQMLILEQTQNNLRALNARIVQLEQHIEETDEVSAKKG